MVGYGVAVSSLTVKFLFWKLSNSFSVHVIRVCSLYTFRLRHVALKDDTLKLWILVQERIQDEMLEHFISLKISTQDGSMQISSGSGLESSHGIHFCTSWNSIRSETDPQGGKVRFKVEICSVIYLQIES